tara:strand:+ start:260 stop:970 length:711 start_codon:yes stop_codon:yes gene_type:complete
LTEYEITVDALSAQFKRLTSGVTFDRLLNPHDTFSGMMALRKYSVERYEVTTESEAFACYRVPEEEAFELVATSLIDADIFDLCQHIVRANIMLGEPLAIGLRTFAISVLEGRYRRPTPPHRVGDKDFLLHLVLFQLVSDAIINHDMKLTRNDASPAVSACDAVSDAVSNCGFDYSFAQIKALCVSSRKKSIRSAVKMFLYLEHGDDAVFLGKAFKPSVSKEEAESELRKYRASAT